ncbi:MAG TPA: GxxExxY protein [Kofleriaceae bacterium]|nr:GxxExxY protein [Kofleriaceae bacterium]
MREPPEHLDELAREVIGAAIEVHKTLGPGFVESVYEAAMLDELARRGVEFENQFVLPVHYKGKLIAEHRLDLVIAGGLVVELKAVESLGPTHFAQLLSYLKAGAFELGLLINFNVELLRHGIRRVVLSH